MRSAAVMPSDEISTIYIVGLPDDLREREFANMFMFAPGFEAAVLHYPALNGASSFNGTLSFHGASSVHGTSSSLHGTSSSLHGASSSLHGSAVTSASQRCSSASEAGNGESTSRSPSSPPTAASISSPASLLSFSTAANSNAGGSASDNAQMSDVEDFYAAVAGSSNSFHNFGISMGISSSAAALFGGDGNAATSAAVAATSAATANGSTSAATGLGSMTHRNQIIGFAKFETKHDALDARDHLNGRYIDMERGLVLKVELTKKNLFLRKPSIVAPLFSATTPTICPGGEHHHHHHLLHSSQDSMSSTAGISASAIVPPTSTTPASLAISTTASTPNGLGSASVISSSSQSALQAGTAAASIITATTSTTPMLTRSSTTIGTYNYNHHTRLTSTDYFGGYGMAASSRDYIPTGSTTDLLSDDYFGLGCSSIHSGPGHVGSGNNGPTAAATLSNSQSSLSVASSSLANFGPNNGRNNCLAPGALIDPYSLLTANGNICCRPASTSSSDGYLSSSGLLAGSSMDRAAAITTATTTFNSSSNNTATSASFSNLPYGGNASAPMSSMTLSGTATSAAALNGGSNGLGATVLSSATAGGGGSASNSSQSSMRCMNISVPGHNTPLPISTPWRPASSVAVVPTVSSITPFRPFFPNSASLYPCNGVALTAQQQLLQHQQLQHQQLQKVMPAGPGQQIPGENPPCNTLYVGNLPMNASEDELRIIFATCAGYKRLSFRNKPNGPMCFVEFEDILCATAAMDGLYGTMLSTSTKGGIRLSFSKNPLGVRSCTPAI